MVGAACCRALQDAGLSFQPVTRADADLLDRSAVDALLANSDCDYLLIAAARVGGIHANDQYPADFIYENLVLETNLIDSAFQHGIRNALFLGSSCIYPRDIAQPMAEAALLTAPLELTNEPYAVAKIAGIKLCESYNRQHGTDYRSLMPTNLYGPGDSFHPERSHVVPALLRRFHEAKVSGASEVVVWGSGNPRREFLHVDDLAAAAVHIIRTTEQAYWSVAEPRCSHINIGTGTDLTIADLAETLREVVDLQAEVVFDSSKPDGTPRKLLDITRIKSLGWQPQRPLKEGLADTYRWFQEQLSAT